jgi:hypothetical protein
MLKNGGYGGSWRGEGLALRRWRLFYFWCVSKMADFQKLYHFATIRNIALFKYSKPSEAKQHQEEIAFMEMAHAWCNWIFDDYPSSYSP